MCTLSLHIIVTVSENSEPSYAKCFSITKKYVLSFDNSRIGKTNVYQMC